MPEGLILFILVSFFSLFIINDLWIKSLQNRIEFLENKFPDKYEEAD